MTFIIDASIPKSVSLIVIMACRRTSIISCASKAF